MPPKKEHNSNTAFMSAEQKQCLYSANAKLCRLVKRCPWMYDRQHPNYAKKHIMDKSWTKIAKDCDDSVASCKERWRNIRAAFARSINIYKTTCGPNRVKPYYLYDDLTFLIKPMTDARGTAHRFPEEMKSDWEDATTTPPILLPVGMMGAVTSAESNLRSPITQTSPEKQPEPESDVEADLTFPDPEVVEVAEVDAELMNCMMDTSNTNQQPATPIVDSTRIASYAAESTSNGDNRFSVTGHDLLGGSTEADAKFLEALLPDMRAMNTRQKIVFKRKIYQSLEEVFESNANFPTVSNSAPNIASAAPAATAPLGRRGARALVGTAQSITHSIANLKEREMQKLQEFLRNLLNQSSSAAAPEQNNVNSRHPMLTRVRQPGHTAAGAGAAKGDANRFEPLQPVKDELVEDGDEVIDFE